MMRGFYITFLSILSFVATPALAATLYFDPPTSSLNRGDAVAVSVRLDTDEAAGECVNAVDGVISYSDNIIPVDISLGQSIFPVWVESPVINKENHTITFAGGIPNGYCGRVPGDPQLTNKLLEIIFRAPGLQVGGSENSNVAEVTFDPQTTVYLNDGFGTQQNPRVLPASFTLAGIVGGEILDPWRTAVLADDVPPEPFSITLDRQETSFNGKYYISFNTSDKQTGISHYEIMEEQLDTNSFFNFGDAAAPWVTTRSPYVLEDQSLSSTVYVRAIDKAGNEYVATLPSRNTSHKISIDTWYAVGAGALTFVCVILLVTVVRYIKKRRRQHISSEALGTDDIKEPKD